MSNPEAPRLLIATGTICAGKTTLMGRLVTEKGFRVLSAITTRVPRDSDFPGEYNYLSGTEFSALDPQDMMYNTQHGAPAARYTLLRSVVRDSIKDTDYHYTRPLSLPSAEKVMRIFGEDVVKVIYLPTPDRAELERRALQRGDDPANLSTRIENESKWDEFAKQVPGFHIAKGQTPDELYEEALHLTGVPIN